MLKLQVMLDIFDDESAALHPAGGDVTFEVPASSPLKGKHSRLESSRTSRFAETVLDRRYWVPRAGTRVSRFLVFCSIFGRLNANGKCLPSPQYGVRS